MDKQSQPPTGRNGDKTNLVLGGITFLFAALAVVFAVNPWGQPPPRSEIPLVDKSFLDTTASRRSYNDLVRAKEDLSDFDCYACHDRKVKPVLSFDDQHNVIVPEAHSNIIMGHGSHNRNNVCFNCHDEDNRETFHTRDGHQLGFADSSQLCGSCHGPTLRDWEAGAHGRISGYWNKSMGEARRLDCVNCHDPHTPRIPSRKPAPGPHPLHPEAHGADTANPAH